jgi:hypothetical protein
MTVLTLYLCLPQLETCGGLHAVDIYALDLSGTKSKLAPLVGCYTDSLDTRTLSNLVSASSWTADAVRSPSLLSSLASLRRLLLPVDSTS